MSTVMTETNLLVAKVFGKKNIQFLELGNPFLIQINNNKYYVYIKNITSAYFKSRPDITRIQLGYSAKLNKICKSNIPFLLLGLDPINDVFACWDPIKIKRRLNAKANISLYSKNSVQKSISGNKIILHELANGDKVFLFKTKIVSDFLEKLENYFPNALVYNTKRVSKMVKDPKVLSYGEDLFPQIDASLKKRVRVFIKENKILDAVALCIEHYGNNYKNMSFSQWHEFVKKL